MTQYRLAALAAATLAVPAHAADTAPDIIVTAQAHPDDPPAVAAARARLARTPGSVSVVAAETYEERLAVGLPDLLRDVPGVLSNKRYGEESRLSIRGSGLDQSYHQRGVLLAQDGVPFADADGFSDFQKIDPLGARYVEVYKGGNALRFGGAQLGGAVNLVSPTGRTAESPFALRLEGGSFGTARAQAQAAGTSGAFDYYGSFNALRADGYRQQESSDEIRGTANIGYRFGGENEVRLIAYAADIDQGVPGALTLSDALNRPTYAGDGVVTRQQARDQKVQRGTLQTHLRLTEGLTFDGGVYVTHTDLHHPISIVIDQQTDTQGAFGRFDLAGTLAGHRADLFFGAYYRHGGTDQQLYLNSAGRDGAMIGNGRQVASGLDLFGEGRFYLIPTVALVAGGSWGRATRDYRNRLSSGTDSVDYDWFSPRVGLLYEKGAVQVYANYTRSVEPPHFGALVQTNTTGALFAPLDTQRAWTAEIGTRGTLGAFTWDVDYYRATVKGELLSFLPSANLPATLFNADRTRHQGIEASLDWLLLERGKTRLRLRQTYAWSDFRFVGDASYGDNRLPVAPEHDYRVSLRYEGRDGLYVEPFVDWRIGRTWVDYANTLKAPGYALLNLSAGYRVGPATLYVDLRNLTGKRYVAEFGAVTDARTASTAVFYPGEGRSAFGGVRFRL